MGLPRSIRVDIDDGDFRVGNDRTACILNGALDRERRLALATTVLDPLEQKARR